MQLDPNKLNRSCSMQLAPATAAAMAAIVRLPLADLDLAAHFDKEQAEKDHPRGKERDKERASGNFSKNKSQDALPFQYGDSLTDREVLEAPLPSRNVKTAPSTPEAESRAFPHHADSTSQLEMSAAHKRHHKQSPDGHSGQKSPHKEVSPKMNKSRNEKFHKLFKNIPEEEVVLNAYSCAYFGDILLQGNLYISPNWFCFHSRILGHEKLIEIHITKVVNITREKTAFIIPNAIGIRTAEDKFVFGSLMSRDSTYKLMWNVWKQSRAGGILDASKDLGDGDVSDINGSLDIDAGDLSADNNNVVMKSSLGVAGDLSEDTSDSDGYVCDRCGQPNADQCDTDCLRARGTCNSAQGKEPRSIDERSREKKTKDYIPYSIVGRSMSAASQVVGKLSSMPRTSLLLVVCGILVLLLIMSAVVMTYKIMVLQARLDNSAGWPEPQAPVSGDTLYRDVYFLNNQYHTATVEKFHSVVRANIELLGQVHSSLKSLQSSTSERSDSCLREREGTTEQGVRKDGET